jgi:hypothetical protein
MISVCFQNNPDELEVIRGELADFFGARESVPYYTLMNYLIKLEVLLKTDQLSNMRSVFQPEVQKDWDQEIGFPKDRAGTGSNRFRNNSRSNYSPNKTDTNSPPSWRGGKNTQGMAYF